ncbi:MAG: HEAT repeat domain-containing protein [Terracidiphilus sp.]
MAIDWENIARQVGGLEPDGSERTVGTDGGRRAIELILGEQNIREAVDHWADQKPGEFTAEMVLRIIRSTVAMERCYEIYKNEPDSRRAGAAVFLLYEMADPRVLPWVREFLDDKNFSVRWNGAMALQEILRGPANDDDIALAKGLLSKAESDPDERIRERAAEIRRRLKSDPSLQHLGL